METIGRDLHRQFPLHEMFVSPQGHGYGPGIPTDPKSSCYMLQPSSLVQIYTLD